MAKFPAMPFWFDAYWLDCSHLSDAEHGRYLLIMKELWTAPKQRIPNDDQWLSRRFRRNVDAIRSEIKPILKEFCECDGNWWSQGRLNDEFAYVNKMSAKQSARAKSRWIKQKGECRGNAPTPTPFKDSESPKSDSVSEAKASDAPNGSSNGSPVDFKKPCYELGEKILGSRYGGLITDALKTKPPDQVLKLLQAAQDAHNPTAYFTGALVKSVKQKGRDLCKA